MYNASCSQKIFRKNCRALPTKIDSNIHKSCKDALNQNSSLPSGRYLLQLDKQSQIYEVYCHMETLDNDECEGGGWTLVMKTGGNTETFKYDSDLWENNQTLKVSEGIKGHLHDVETKLASYNNTPFSKICLGMKVQNPASSDPITKWIGVDYEASSLYSLIADRDGVFKSLNVLAQKWQSLIGGSLLPVECPSQGFNVPSQIFSAMKRVRLGYLAHKTCHQQEGLLGFGMNLDGFSWSSGYNYPSRSGNGDKQISALGYIYVR